METELYKNFAMTFAKLLEFSQQELKDDLDKAGLIQGFEFTFEQCWKAIQKVAVSEGVTINSPKSAFTWALGNGWISPADEKLWLDMLEDRNLTTHTYRQEVAAKVIDHIKKRYVSAFGSLLKKMGG